MSDEMREDTFKQKKGKSQQPILLAQREGREDGQKETKFAHPILFTDTAFPGA